MCISVAENEYLMKELILSSESLIYICGTAEETAFRTRSIFVMFKRVEEELFEYLTVFICIS